MKIYRAENIKYTFGAHCIFDDKVQQIVDSPSITSTDYIRDIFSRYKDETSVLFTLTNDCGGKEKKIVAINLDNGQVYPEKVNPSKSALNSLMGYLMHGNSKRHNTFWYSPKNIKL